MEEHGIVESVMHVQPQSVANAPIGGEVLAEKAWKKSPRIFFLQALRLVFPGCGVLVFQHDLEECVR